MRGRFRYKHLDMADLEEQLKKADGEGAKVRMIATDGSYSALTHPRSTFS